MARQQPRSIDTGSPFRTGRNVGGTAIAERRILKYGAGEDEVALSTAATDKFAGVTVEEIDAGGHQSYQREGVAVVDSGGPVSIYGYVTADASGKAVAAATGNVILGIALDAATGADEPIRVELLPGRSLAP